MSKNNKTRPWDLLNPKTEFLNESESKKRLDICLNCDRLFKPTVQCKECGCFMTLKTKIAHATCPLNKWEK
jgi:hypothetical protein